MGRLQVTSGISIFFGKLFKLDKCCERQKEESQLWLGGVLSQACWRNVQGSQLSAVVILMLRSQATTRSACRNISAQKAFFQHYYGVWGAPDWLKKGCWGGAVNLSDHCQVCQRWQTTPFPDTQDIPSKVRQLSRHLAPLFTRTVDARANVGCEGGHWCTPRAPWLWS